MTAITNTGIHRFLSKEIDASKHNLPDNTQDISGKIDLAPPDFAATNKSDAFEIKAASDKLYKEHNINLGRYEFIKNIGFLTLSLIGVGLTATLTGFSGGGGLPLLALASTQFMISLADTLSAYSNWQTLKSDKELLPRGSDSLANLAYKTAIHFNLSEKYAGWAASCFSAFVRAGLICIPSASNVFNAPQVARNIHQIYTLGGSSVTVARSMVNGGTGWYSGTALLEKEKLLVETIKENAALKEAYKQLMEERHNALLSEPVTIKKFENTSNLLLA